MKANSGAGLSNRGGGKSKKGGGTEVIKKSVPRKTKDVNDSVLTLRYVCKCILIVFIITLQ